MSLTIIIPFYNGHSSILRLLNSIPKGFPIIIVDDMSDPPLTEFMDEATLNQNGCRVIRMTKKGYFTGAVNRGIESCSGDVLVLNQDSYFENQAFFALMSEKSREYALIGEKIKGTHPAWPMGYIHGTCMFMRRDAIQKAGLMDAENYPLWGSTCEWQLRVCRKGFKVLPLNEIPGFAHDRPGQYGEAITEVMHKEPDKKRLFIRTPPMVSVIVPCYNYGRYLQDCINSLIGGSTTLGLMSGQTFQSFEIIIVDDCSTDNSAEIAKKLADPWKGIHFVKTPVNGGTAYANNYGITNSHGKYITILSSDDMREPESLEKLYKANLENPHSFAYDDAVILVDGKRSKVWKMDTYDYEKLIYKNQVHASIMFPYDAWKEVGGYPEEMRYGREDWAFNVGMGAFGYCGIHVDYPGLIYRREGQNRTLTNTTPEWRNKFLVAIQAKYPDIYSGRFPMGCCGSNSKVPSGAGAKSSGTYSAEKSLPGAAGMVLVDYVGNNYGNRSFYGPYTGTHYVFSKKKFRRNVDIRDLNSSNKSGLLDIMEDKKPAFQVVKAPKKAPAPAPVSLSRPEPVEEVVAVASVAVEPEPVNEPEPERSDLYDIPGLDKSSVELLLEKAVGSIAQLLETDIDNLKEQTGWSKTRIKAIISAAKKV